MIPYEQLVSALTSWRQRNGLPTAAADLFGAPVGLPIGDLGAYPGEPVEEMADDAILADEADEVQELGADGDATGDEAGFDSPESTAISGVPSGDEGAYDTFGSLDDDPLTGDLTDGGPVTIKRR